jgi:hypothetical protein
MELLQRDFQKQILHALSDQYPATVDLGEAGLAKHGRQLAYNLAYLEEHELITVIWTHPLSGEPFAGMAKITAAGIDFISDDGGLSAILGVVTVKLHEDTVKALLVDKVAKSTIEPTIKRQLIDEIKKLPALMTRDVAMAALKKGIEDIPDVVSWVQQFLSHSH